MFGCYLLEVCSLLMRDRKGVNLKGRGGVEELGRVEEGENCNQDILNEKRIYFLC